MDSNVLALVSTVGGIVSAFVSNNPIRTDEIPGLIQSTYKALVDTQTVPEPEVTVQEPAVSIRSSVKPDHIVCLEDGKKLKMLKRYIMKNYNMTPAEYRAKWNLPSDYPMTAPNYAATRAELAKKIGLGVKAKVSAPVAAPAPDPKPVVRYESAPAVTG